MNIKASSKRCIKYGAIMMAIAVVLGAFGTHYLKNILNEYSLSIYNTALSYQIYHSLGLFILAFISMYVENIYLKIARISMLLGIVIFCGSLYALSFSGYKMLGAITPVGGLLFIIAWVMVVISLNSKNKIV